MSGLDGYFFAINFLIIENKFSKQGYHKSKIIKNGDTVWFSLNTKINKLENKNPRK